MTEAAARTEGAARPVEVELKYRVVDLAAAERYLVAEEIGAFSGTAAARSSIGNRRQAGSTWKKL